MSKKKNNFSRRSNLGLRNKTQSPRQQKVSTAISAEIINCLRRGGNVAPELIDCPLNITKVTISADLKLANCFYLPFNTKLTAEQMSEALEKSKYHIRGFVTKNLNLKFSPELRFFYDSAFEENLKLDQMLSQ